MTRPAADPLAMLLCRTRRRVWLTRGVDALPGAIVAATLVLTALRLCGTTDSTWPLLAFAAALLPAVLRRPTLRATAADLEARHHTGDLLLSAWLTPPDDPWALALRRSANQLAETLPARGPVGRVPARTHGCVAAACVAVVAVVLTRPSATPSVAATPADVAAIPGPAVQTAAERGRRADTGERATGLPGDTLARAAPAGGGRRTARDGADARGSGRAEGEPAAVAVGPSAPVPSAFLSPTVAAARSAGGPGRAGEPGDVAGGGGVDAPRRTPGSAGPLTPGVAGGPPTGTAVVDELPYRALVRDFFER